MEVIYGEYLGLAEPGKWTSDPFPIDEVWLRARAEK